MPVGTCSSRDDFGRVKDIMEQKIFQSKKIFPKAINTSELFVGEERRELMSIKQLVAA